MTGGQSAVSGFDRFARRERRGHPLHGQICFRLRLSLVIQLRGGTVAGTDYDQLAVSGDVDLDADNLGGATLVLDAAGSAATPASSS